MNITLVLSLFILFLPFPHSFAGNSANHAVLPVYVIPGLGAGRNTLTSVERVFEGTPQVHVVQVAVPASPDLGQARCMGGVRETFSNNKPDGVIIYARSQGTATALNYLAEEDQGKHIKALVLEAVLASGNSAICHTAKGLSNLARLPLSYYWAPYCAKAYFPHYWPAGKQPIKALDRVPTTIPTIIVHSKGDKQIPYDDACAFYYGLRMRGNNNVYLISKDSHLHVGIVDKREKEVMLSILQKHGVLQANGQEAALDLSQYQPDPAPFKQLYDDLVHKESCHRYLGYSLVASALCATTFVIKYLCGKLRIVS